MIGELEGIVKGEMGKMQGGGKRIWLITYEIHPSPPLFFPVKILAILRPVFLAADSSIPRAILNCFKTFSVFAV